MRSMHVAFCKMAVDMLRNDPGTRQQDLVKAWDDTHYSIWNAQIGAQQRFRCCKGHPPGGKAGGIFSNAMLSMAILRRIAANEAPFPVALPHAPFPVGQFPVEAGGGVANGGAGGGVPAQAKPAAAARPGGAGAGPAGAANGGAGGGVPAQAKPAAAARPGGAGAVRERLSDTAQFLASPPRHSIAHAHALASPHLSTSQASFKH